MPHGAGRRSGRGAHDPIGLAAPTRIEAQGVTAARPHDQCGGEDAENEDHPHDDRRHDVVKDQANLEPEPVERLQQARPYDCDHEEESRERKRPQVRLLPVIKGQNAMIAKTAAKTKPKERCEEVCLISPRSKFSCVAVMHGLYLIQQPQGNFLAAEPRRRAGKPEFRWI